MDCPFASSPLSLLLPSFLSSFQAGHRWQQIGGTAPFLERPVTRKEVIALEKRFDVAMAYATQASTGAPVHSHDASTLTDPVFEQDVINTRTRILEDLYDGDREDCPRQQAVCGQWIDLPCPLLFFSIRCQIPSIHPSVRPSVQLSIELY